VLQVSSGCDIWWFGEQARSAWQLSERVGNTDMSPAGHPDLLQWHYQAPTVLTSQPPQTSGWHPAAVTQPRWPHAAVLVTGHLPSPTCAAGSKRRGLPCRQGGCCQACGRLVVAHHGVHATQQVRGGHCGNSEGRRCSRSGGWWMCQCFSMTAARQGWPAALQQAPTYTGRQPAAGLNTEHN
jgi:hypothetical protein